MTLGESQIDKLGAHLNRVSSCRVHPVRGGVVNSLGGSMLAALIPIVSGRRASVCGAVGAATTWEAQIGCRGLGVSRHAWLSFLHVRGARRDVAFGYLREWPMIPRTTNSDNHQPTDNPSESSDERYEQWY